VITAHQPLPASQTLQNTETEGERIIAQTMVIIVKQQQKMTGLLCYALIMVLATKLKIMFTAAYCISH